jgi:hypothetical protein
MDKEKPESKVIMEEKDLRLFILALANTSYKQGRDRGFMWGVAICWFSYFMAQIINNLFLN